LTAAVEDELKDERIHPWNVIELNEKTWKWLHPLLLRLKTAEGVLHEEQVMGQLALAAK
jgi:hypothetical protein